jgi:hypothetical protein
MNEHNDGEDILAANFLETFQCHLDILETIKATGEAKTHQKMFILRFFIF